MSLDNTLVYYGCSINHSVLPFKLKCQGPFQTVKEADDYLDNTLGKPENRLRTHATTIIPSCRYLPEFLNHSRACYKATTEFIRK